VQDWPRTPHLKPYSWAAEAFENEFVPDAFGLQLFGRRALHQVPAARAWRRRRVSAGSTLEHRDLERWFDGSLVRFGGYPNSLEKEGEPIPELLGQARRDFEPMLIRDELIRP
jgi:hypothetical protein